MVSRVVVVRHGAAKPVQPPDHEGMRSLNLMSPDVGGPAGQTVFLSHYLPDGSAGPGSGASGKTYVVLSGTMDIEADGERHVLGALDSCHVPPGVQRYLVNHSNMVATTIVISSP